MEYHNPSIGSHEIKLYHGSKPVRKNLLPVHPKKTTIIKEEIENLLNVGFIYPATCITFKDLD
jgi:hypothetical protein